jgi:hypothetical protein
MKAKTYFISRVYDTNSDSLFQIVSDFGNYSRWNTVIPRANGKLVTGSELALIMKIAGKTKPFNPKVVSIDPGTSFVLSKTWITKIIGELTHRFEFVVIAENKTEFIQTWTGKGILVKIIWPIIEKGFSEFKIFNDDLENYVKKQNTNNG